MINVGTAVAYLTLDTSRYSNALQTAASQIQSFTDTSRGASERLSSLGSGLQTVGTALTLGVTAPLVGLGALATKTSIELESAFAGVRKTVDATEAEFATLRGEFDGLSKSIPIAVTEIYGIGEAAGQLGIAKENIVGFTETMANLGAATNMTSETAATSLARLANITGMSQTEFDRLGSTVVHLGNNLATTETEIVSMALRLAGAGSQIGLTEAEILSFAGSLSAVGIQAEMGGSAFSKLMVELQLAVETGSESLSAFAAVAGMSAEQFQTAFRDDAAQAILAFVSGLGQAEERGMSAIAVLQELDITEVRMRDTLLRAANASDLFTQSINMGTQAWNENTALTDEANERYKTTASQIQLLKNNLVLLGDSFGQILLPTLNDFLQALIPILQNMAEWDDSTKKAIVTVAGLVAVIGPLTTVIGTAMKAVSLLSSGAKLLGGAFTGLGPIIAGTMTPITGLGKVVGGLASTARLAGSAITGIFGGISSAGSAMVGLLKPLLAGLFSPWGLAIAGAVAAGYLIIKNWDAIMDVGGKMIGFLMKLPAQAVQVGIDIVQGMARGIISVAQSVINIVADLAGAIMGTFKNLLGIRSPSRVFQEYGKNIVEGTAKGVKENRKLAIKELEALVKDLKETMEENINSINQVGDAIIKALKARYDEAEKMQIDFLDDRIEREKAYSESLLKVIEDNDKAEKKHLENRLSDAKKASEEVIKELDREYKETIKVLEEKEKAESKYLDNSLKALKANTDERIKEIDREYNEQLKLIDAEAYAEAQALQDQINELDAITEAEEKALKEQEYNKRIAELNKTILESNSAQERIRAQEELNKLTKQRERELLLEERNNQKQALKDQIQDIKDAANEKKEILKQETADKKEAEKEKQAVEEERIREEKEGLKESIAAIKEAEREKLDAAKEREKEQLKLIEDGIASEKELLAEKTKDLKEAEKQRLEAIVNGLNAEKDKIKEHYDILTLEENLKLEARKMIIEKNQEEIVELLNKYNPKWQDAGQSFADMLVHGLNSEKQTVADAIAEVINLAPVVNEQIQSLERLEAQLEKLRNLESGGGVGKGKGAGAGGGAGVDGLGDLGGLGGVKTDIEEVGNAADAAGVKVDNLTQRIMGLGETSSYTTKTALGEIQIFGEGVSEATQKAVLAYLEMEENAIQSLNAMVWSSQTITPEIVAQMSTQFTAMKDQVVSSYQAQKDEALALLQAQFEESNVLTEEEKAEALRITAEKFDQQILAYEENHARIMEILQLASTEGRAIKEEERAEILRIMQEMNVEAIAALTTSEQEQIAILNRLKDESGKISAIRAAEIIKASLDQKEQTIKLAEEEYDGVMKAVAQLRKDGSKEAEDMAKKLIEEAEKQKKETISNAEEMHKRVVEEASKQSESHIKYVDTETGEVKSKWGILKTNLGETLKQIKKDFQDEWEETSTHNRKAWDGMVEDVSKSGSNMLTNVREFLKNLESDYGKGMTDTKRQTYESWKNMDKDVDDFTGNMNKTVDKNSGDMKKNLLTAWKDMDRDADREMASVNRTVKKSMDDLPGAMERAGNEVGNGFIRGINQKESSILSKARGIANAVSKTFKNALDIHSPSRVFMGFGENVGEGLIIGMDNTIPDVMKAANEMATATTVGDFLGANSTQEYGGYIPYRAPQPTKEEKPTTIENNYEIHATIREESDVDLLAEKLFRLQQEDIRSRGGTPVW